MSQRINVRLADSRRGSQAFIAIVAVLLLIGAGVGGWWWWSTREQPNAPGKTATAADSTKNLLGSVEASLKKIAEDPTKADDEITDLKEIAETDIGALKDQLAKADATVKTSAVAMIVAQIPNLQKLVDAAYKVPGVQAKLEPIVKKIMDGLNALKA